MVGMFVGAMPGLTSGTGLILILPLTFYMEKNVAFGMLVSAYISALCAGGLTAVYFNIPGTPQAAVTALDGHPMTQKGLDNEAAGIVIGSSFIGGFLSYVILSITIGPLGEIATKFGPIELFFTALLGMICAAGVKTKYPLKGLAAGFAGFLLGTIGLSPMGRARATYGIVGLVGGIPFMPILIGQLAMSEVLLLIEKETAVPKSFASARTIKRVFKGMMYPYTKPLGVLIGSLIGTVVGAIPGEGATMASFLSYSRAKQSSKRTEEFGTGIPEGVMASELADNASTGGGLLTSLLLGIPGTASCAVLLAALMLHGLQAGPVLIVKYPDVISYLLASLFVSNFIMVFFAIIVAYYIGVLLFTPTRALVPVIALFCTLGAYLARNAVLDVWLMLIFAILGWWMRKYEYPTIALVVGLIVAPIADAELVRAIRIFGGDILIGVISSPIALIMIGLNLILLFFMFRGWSWKGPS
jgi:putative tricarboxylic transport membrane protein